MPMLYGIYYKKVKKAKNLYHLVRLIFLMSDPVEIDICDRFCIAKHAMQVNLARTV